MHELIPSSGKAAKDLSFALQFFLGEGSCAREWAKGALQTRRGTHTRLSVDFTVFFFKHEAI